jgi:Ca2+-binding RTX toxin-like protein
METSIFTQVIDVLDLTEGSHQIINGDRILGTQSNSKTSEEKAQLGDLDILVTSFTKEAPPSFESALPPETNVIQGTKKADNIVGTNADDHIFGKKGNDFINGGKGNDKLYGQEGDDTLIGGKGNDLLVGGGKSGELDQLYGGKGKDTFSLVNGSDPGYLNDDGSLDDGVNNRGFAVIHDFKLGQDKVQLAGFAAHYALVPVFWGQSFGSASKVDTAIIYKGPEQDKSDVVGVLKDVSLSSAYLEIPETFTYVN